MVGTSNYCQATNARGEPCGAYAVKGSAFCFWHSPERALDRKEASAAGGRSRHGRALSTVAGEPVHLSSLGDVVSLLEQAVSDALCLENSIQRARCLGYLAGIAARALEASDLEQRIVRLEEQLGVTS